MSDLNETGLCDVETKGRCDRCDHPCPGYFTMEWQPDLDRDEDFSEWDWYEDDFEDDQPGCGCPFCMCSNPTIAGETCNDCLAGSHQG